MQRFALLAAFLLAACVAGPGPQPYPQAPVALPPPDAPLAAPDPVLTPQATARNFIQVVRRMGPLVEAECRNRQPTARCDFAITVDTTEGAPANAYQTRDPSGRPVIAFTLALIQQARNADELAFVMGHESAHHILAHIPRSERTAAIGGMLGGMAAAAMGADPTMIRTAQDLGTAVGTRIYSKDMELEADRLGTILAWKAGFDPERGAAFFARIPDPGESFLGSHPPNAQRLAVVRQTLAEVKAGL